MPTLQTDTSHILPHPIYISVIRIAQFFFAIALLGLAAYGANLFAISGVSLTLVTAILTLLAIFYILISQHFHQLLYNYYAVLGLDIFLCVFWLVSFAVVASQAAAVREFLAYADDADGYLGFGVDAVVRYGNTLVADAVMGAGMFVSFIITSLHTAYSINLHRQKGGHCQPNPQPIIPRADLEMEPRDPPLVPQDRVGEEIV